MTNCKPIVVPPWMFPCMGLYIITLWKAHTDLTIADGGWEDRRVGDRGRFTERLYSLIGSVLITCDKENVAVYHFLVTIITVSLVIFTSFHPMASRSQWEIMLARGTWRISGKKTKLKPNLGNNVGQKQAGITLQDIHH